VVPARSVEKKLSLTERVRLFDESVERRRRKYKRASGPPPVDRGWTREELYDDRRRRYEDRGRRR